MSSNYTTFRVRGIPAGSSKEDVEALVKEALASEDSALFRLKSLANDRPRSREMVATINFESIPAQLAGCISGSEWSSELSDDVALLFDTHFHGCTTLSCPPEDSWKFDVFAISGLNGHAFGSFKKKNASYMWLRDTLRRDFPESRIIIYGYDSMLHSSKSFQNILDIGQKFRSALTEARPNKDKPLILVGHSLGGIVVKEAINAMRISEFDQDRLNFTAIRGIVFFGVPNQGMDIRSLVPMVGDQPNRGLLQNLEHNSPTLRYQAKDFSAALGDLHCDVLNFYETQESPTARQDESGKWSMTGPSAVLVNTFSATHGRPDNARNHRVYPIDRGHSDLVKFSSPHDEAYKTLVAYLNGINFSETEPSAVMSKVQAGCFRSLGFREQYHRLDTLDPAKGTCDWLIQHDYFVEWLANPIGLLWIRGIPGSGKSMAMKRMLNHVESLNSGETVVASFFFHAQGVDLQRNILGLYRALLHQLYPHFLDAFSDLTARFKKYKKDFGEGKQDADWSWMNGEIRKYFIEGVPNACRQKSIVLFIDAVDEAGESSAKEIFCDLQQLLDSLSDHTCQLRVCLSCRHYPEIILESGKTLVMESFNHDDMARVISTRIDRLSFFNDVEKHQIKTDVLEKSGGVFQWTSLVVDSIVQERKRGNQFEAALEAMKEVPRSLDLLYTALLKAGDEQCSSIEREKRRTLFHWVLFAARPLSPKELQHALAVNYDTKHSSIHDYETSPEFITAENYETRIRTLSKGLIQIRGPTDSGQVEFIHQSVVDFLNSCAGLHLFSHAPEPVRFAHFEISRSCLKYLFMAEIKHMLQTRSKELRNLRGGTAALTRAATDVKQMFPLISYAWNHWIFHAVSAKGQENKATDHNDDDILEAFQWPNDQLVTNLWVLLRKVLGCPLKSWHVAFCPDVHFRPYDNFYDHGTNTLICPVHRMIGIWPDDGTRLIHLFALCGLLDGCVQARMISEATSLEHPATEGPTPLVYAISGKQKRVIRTLITAGARVHYDKWHYCYSPIHVASIWGDVEVMSLLIKSGASLTASSCWPGYTPLHLAASFGRQAAVDFLLNGGVNINPRTRMKETPLVLAYRNEQNDVFKKLLKAGADVNLGRFHGKSVLCIAASENDRETVELLLRMGARLVESVLPAAVSSGSLDIVKFFLEKGINVNARGVDGSTSLTVAMCHEDQDQEIAKLLIASGARLNRKCGEELQAPLHDAAARNDIRSAELLLQHGADPNIKDIWGKTPLIEAMSRTNNEVGRILLEAGADVNLKDMEGKTALMAAAASDGSEKVEAIRLLLQFGADPTARTRSGVTARCFSQSEHDLDEILRDAGVPQGNLQDNCDEIGLRGALRGAILGIYIVYRVYAWDLFRQKILRR